ncbi:hypothetical protein HOG16_04015 [Candidatus Woesearchaeota archaeon]|nr:hypothetical protein [Candidatus Woesearchaeota archaeon]
MKKESVLVSFIFLIVLTGIFLVSASDISLSIGLNDVEHTVELISVSDSSVTVTIDDSDSREIDEQSTPYTIYNSPVTSDLKFIVTNADEQNLKLNTTMLIGFELNLDIQDPSDNFIIDGVSNNVELISASDTAATIAVTNAAGQTVSKEIDIQQYTGPYNLMQAKKIGDFYVILKDADESNLDLSANILVFYEKNFFVEPTPVTTCEEGYTCLDSDNPTQTTNIAGSDYTLELISASDTAATIAVTNTAGTTESKEISEDQSKAINGISVYLKSSDETAFKLTAVIKATSITTCEEGYTCLDSDNPTQTVNVAGSDYTLELISASDTAATIAVTNTAGTTESKEISEDQSKIINGISIYLKNADENNLQLTAVIKASEEKCSDIGLRKKGKYCSYDNQWINQNNNEESCENNFECISNVCVDSECIRGSIFKEIINWFKRVFGGQ